MPEGAVNFGFLPKQLDISTEEISIETLAGSEDVIQTIRASKQVDKDWNYAPPHDTLKKSNGDFSELPYPTRVFSLPPTHLLRHKKDNDKSHLEFLIWCLGFFEGLRLTTEKAGYLDATPIKPGKLTDFHLSGETKIGNALELAERYWRDHRPVQNKRMTGVIHCLFLAQNRRHMPFEKFTYLYMALDGCYKATSETGGHSHGKRIAWTCKQFEMSVPDWANPHPNQTEISKVRNDTIHETLFFGEPIGFVPYGGSSTLAPESNVPLQMHALTCRLIVALLGMPNAEYVHTPVDKSQNFDLCFT